MCQLPPNICRQNGHDLGAVLSVASRQRPRMIEWLISPALTRVQDAKGTSTNFFNATKRRNENATRDDEYVQRYGHVKRDGYEWSRWPPLHANERDQECRDPLSTLRERNAYRGRTGGHRRRRFRNFQADQRSGERPECV